MKTKIYLSILLMAFSISGAFAHALWIETASTGKKGQPQEIKVFFGEYESKKPDSAKQWFSNLKEFNLVLTAPDGSSKILKTSPDLLFFKTSFIPDQTGIYKLSIVHTVATIYEHAKINYYAFADISVGASSKINNQFPVNAVLTIRPEKYATKTGEAVNHLVIYNKEPFANQKITVVNPDWSKQELQTSATGLYNFVPAQKGNYFMEAFAEDKTPGNLGNQAYDKTWHLVTYLAEIK